MHRQEIYRIYTLRLITIFSFILFLSACNSTEHSSKASFVKVGVKPTEHLASLSFHDIKPVSYITSLGKIPVYGDFKPHDKEVAVYDGLFWEVTPMGQYVYYLAGDFKKNEKGLLRFGSQNTELRVEISYEDDAIDVAGYEMNYKYEQASRGSRLDLSDLQELQLLSIDSLLNKSLTVDGSYYSRGIFKNSELGSKTSKSRFEFMKYKGNAKLVLLYEDVLKPQSENEEPRYLKIIVSSKQADLDAGALSSLFKELVSVYYDMPYSRLSGATRM